MRRPIIATFLRRGIPHGTRTYARIDNAIPPGYPDPHAAWATPRCGRVQPCRYGAADRDGQGSCRRKAYSHLGLGLGVRLILIIEMN